MSLVQVTSRDQSPDYSGTRGKVDVPDTSSTLHAYLLTLLLYVGLSTPYIVTQWRGKFSIGNRRNKNDLYIMNECPWIQEMAVL